MNLSEEQILALAPDESSKKSGRELSNPLKWVTRSFNEQALWGECQGSGTKPYQTQVDLNNIAFKCSCPSRKFPCKHGIGLLLLFAKNRNTFTAATPPGWVTEWLSRREARQDKEVEKKDTPADAAAQLKRQEARQSKVTAGVAELNLWLQDIIRGGILTMPDKGPSFFENMSKRLIDAQAPGLAGMVRELGGTNFFAEDWPTDFLEQMIRIYLVIEGFRNSSTLEAGIRSDIMTSIGFTQNQEELRAQAGVADTWLVIGKQVAEVDNITTEKFWLQGINTGRFALLLQFIVQGQGAQFNLSAGMFVQAELVFFSSALPLRALIKIQSAAMAALPSKAYNNWNEVAEKETEFNSAQPFSGERPFFIKQLRPVQYQEQWWLQDASNNMKLLKPGTQKLWKLLSISGGAFMDMAVVGRGARFEPLGVWLQNEYKTL